VPWRAVARSVIGTSHLQQQLSCQDFGGERILGDVLFGAVADGAGSAAYSDVGAQLAVKIVLEYLELTEIWLQKRQQSWRSLAHPPSQELTKKLFTKIVNKVNLGLRKQAETSDYAVDDLACTLLVFLATPRWLAAMQIGDGFIVVRPKRKDYQLLFKPDKGEYANQTTFVTSTSALADMQISVLPHPPKFVCASTDALERVAIRLSDWAPFPPFFKPFEEYMVETLDPETDDEYLMSFLKSDRLNSRTDDDKTLLLCLYK